VDITHKSTTISYGKPKKMPLKTLICKKCNAVFVPENDLQKITQTCNVCLKEQKEIEEEESYLIEDEEKE